MNMLKVATGHYRDTFEGRVYDVRRTRHQLAGWEYIIDPRGKNTDVSGWISTPFPTKEIAAASARRHIAQEG